MMEPVGGPCDCCGRFCRVRIWADMVLLMCAICFLKLELGRVH